MTTRILYLCFFVLFTSFFANDEDVNQRLLYACYNGQQELILELLKNNANVNTVDKHGYTPLIQAARGGQKHIIRLLIEKGADPKIKTNCVYSFFNVVSSLGDLSLIKSLLEIGLEADQDSLSSAVKSGNESCVALILTRILKADNESLQIAAMEKRNLAIVNLLVSHGANVNTNFYASTLIDSLIVNKQKEIALFLLEKGAKVTFRSLEYATENADITLVEKILEKGVDIENSLSRFIVNNFKLKTAAILLIIWGKIIFYGRIFLMLLPQLIVIGLGFLFNRHTSKIISWLDTKPSTTRTSLLSILYLFNPASFISFCSLYICARFPTLISICFLLGNILYHFLSFKKFCKRYEHPYLLNVFFLKNTPYIMLSVFYGILFYLFSRGEYMGQDFILMFLSPIVLGLFIAALNLSHNFVSAAAKNIKN